MRPSTRLDRHRLAVAALCARHEADNPRVFGSVLRGTDTAASDLDLLVDTEPGLWMACPAGLQRELVALLGVPVDLATPENLPPAWRDAVVAEAQPVRTWRPRTLAGDSLAKRHEFPLQGVR